MNSFNQTYKDSSPTVKILIIVMIVVTIYVIGKKAFELLNPNNRTTGALGAITGGSSSPNVALNNTAGASYQAPNTEEKVRNLVDLIYDKLKGINYVFIYPEVVNRLANLSVADLKKAAQYWGAKYATGEGKNFYQFIDAEYHAGRYDPALGALKKTGYYGN